LGFSPNAKVWGLKSCVWVMGNARAAQGVLKMKIQPGASFSARGVAKITILGCSATLGGPCGKEKAYFYTLFSENAKPNRVFSRGLFAFYFLPLNLFFSPPARKFHMIFSRFPAAAVLFGHFSGHWRCGSGGGWKVPEKGFKMLSGWPWGVKNTLRGGIFPGLAQNAQTESLCPRNSKWAARKESSMRGPTDLKFWVAFQANGHKSILAKKTRQCGHLHRASGAAKKYR
jgi:hypothetical protein